MKPHDISGQRFGRVVATSINKRDAKHSYWNYLCDCGSVGVTTMNALRRGLVVSCGCFRKEFCAKKATSHGDTAGGEMSTEYRIWAAMKRRCDNKNRPEWPNYGGRGISYCERWAKFENFLEDMGRRPHKHSIDRIDNDGNYSKDNCRWATTADQMNNTRANRYVIFKGDKILLKDAASISGITLSTVYRRIGRGLSEDEWFKPTGR